MKLHSYPKRFIRLLISTTDTINSRTIMFKINMLLFLALLLSSSLYANESIKNNNHPKDTSKINNQVTKDSTNEVSDFIESNIINNQANLNSKKANQHKLLVGLKLQKTMKLYWENGISIQYQPLFLWAGRPLVSFDFISSRLGTAIASNALQQETYRFGLGARFRNDKIVQPGFRINSGLFHLDVEEEIFEDLNNNSFVLALDGLINFNYKNLNLETVVGYHLLTDPGSLYPLYISFEGMWGFQW